jgi:GNAT superfamily N-acetyltransferase
MLAEMNLRLIQDEAHRKPMDVPALENRMQAWLRSGEYEAVLFDGPPVIAYALFRQDPDSIYLRQFFVERSSRRRGVGRLAFEILTREVWPPKTRITIDVLVNNEAGIAFWRSIGFRNYVLTMELAAHETTERTVRASAD